MNRQNDIIGILDSSGTQVVSYAYDTWGKLLGVSGNTTLGNLNPFRYRGYYYDSETSLYYLQSRYYDPQTGRFLNADDSAVLGLDQSSVFQYNLFTYCLNNPVNNSDPSGYISLSPVSGFGGWSTNINATIHKWAKVFGPKSKSVEYGAILFRLRVGLSWRYFYGPTYKGFETPSYYTVVNGLVLGGIMGLYIKQLSRIFGAGAVSLQLVGFIHSHPDKGPQKPEGPDLYMKYIPIWSWGRLFPIVSYDGWITYA